MEAYLRNVYYNLFFAKDGEKFNPLSLVANNDVTDLYELGPWMTIIGDYRKGMINERYGLSFLEFIKLPKYIADLIMLDATLETKSQSQQADNMKREQERKEKDMKL